MDSLRDFIEKKVYVILKSGRKYTGVVIGIDDSGPPLIFVTIIDKFDKKVTFAKSEIELIQEEGE